jgi:hypothetical protein
MAFGLLHLRRVGGWEGWRWLFLVEGFIMLYVGVASFFMMPASAVQTKTWFRPAGWFTERVEAIVVNRVLRDDPSKGGMHNRGALTPRRAVGSLEGLRPIAAVHGRAACLCTADAAKDVHHPNSTIHGVQHFCHKPAHDSIGKLLRSMKREVMISLG